MKTGSGVLALAMSAVVCGAGPVWAQQCPDRKVPDPGLMTADFALARPAGAVATVAGFAIFLVSSPFSAMGGNSQQAWEGLVADPADYTFKRPLGQFDCPPPSRPVKQPDR